MRASALGPSEPGTAPDAAALARLRAIFGDCVPKKNAAVMVEQSPQAPLGDADRQALRALAERLAGEKLGAHEQPAPARGVLAARMAATADVRRSDGLVHVLSPAACARAFHDVAARPDVPHAFLEEGCLHRSHVIAKRLEDAGIFSEKIFTIPNGGDLVIETPKAKLGYTVSWYHEAVVVHVQTPAGVERRVLDPSLADEPLTVPAWLAHMHGSAVTPSGEPREPAPLETFYLPRFAYGLSARNDPPTTWNEAELANAFAWNDGWRALEQQLVTSGFYDALPKLAGRA